MGQKLKLKQLLGLSLEEDIRESLLNVHKKIHPNSNRRPCINYMLQSLNPDSFEGYLCRGKCNGYDIILGESVIKQGGCTSRGRYVDCVDEVMIKEYLNEIKDSYPHIFKEDRSSGLVASLVSMFS